MYNEELSFVILTKYYQDDQIKEYEIGGECRVHMGDASLIYVLIILGEDHKL